MLSFSCEVRTKSLLRLRAESLSPSQSLDILVNNSWVIVLIWLQCSRNNKTKTSSWYLPTTYVTLSLTISISVIYESKVIHTIYSMTHSRTWAYQTGEFYPDSTIWQAARCQFIRTPVIIYQLSNTNFSTFPREELIYIS